MAQPRIPEVNRTSAPEVGLERRSGRQIGGECDDDQRAGDDLASRRPPKNDAARDRGDRERLVPVQRLWAHEVVQEALEAREGHGCRQRVAKRQEAGESPGHHNCDGERKAVVGTCLSNEQRCESECNQ